MTTINNTLLNNKNTCYSSTLPNAPLPQRIQNILARNPFQFTFAEIDELNEAVAAICCTQLPIEEKKQIVSNMTSLLKQCLPSNISMRAIQSDFATATDIPKK